VLFHFAVELTRAITMSEPVSRVIDPEELRNHLAAVVASSDDAIISKTLDGIIVSWNEGAERIFGYAAEEVIGKSITLILPPDHLDEEPQILARLRRGERIDHYQTVRMRKDGSRVDISLTVSPVRNSRGDIVGASKIARDITLQKRAEEALRVNDSRFRIMADSAPVLIWMANTARTFTWFNQTWREFTGRPMDEELGFGWTQNVHADDLQNCLDTFTQSFEKRAPFRLEHRLGRHDGTWRWVINQGTPLYEGVTESFSGYVGSCIDITDMRQAQSEHDQLLQAERSARAEAERLGRMKDEFLATLSHELRTPLNAILGWSTLLRRLGSDSPDYQRGLDTIERNARIQGQIVGDLLDMSRIISGKVQLDIEPLDLQEVLTAAIDSVRPSIEAKKLRFRTVFDARAARIRGDANRLQQVFWNLLTNAVKFTPSGGSIQVTLERVNSHVEVTVEDSGIGIKPEFLAFVFDRFRQADSTTSRRYGGLGLGLSIVKHLIEHHGGSVRVKSPGEGLGSSFIVALPVSAIHSSPTDRLPEVSFGEFDLSAVELPSLSNVRVLIVDDEDDARYLIDRFIVERGGQSVMAKSAAEALQVLANERVDIIVSDVGMPDIDGYELIRRVRKASAAANTMAIALTAYARAEDRQRALLAGYQMHLAKPVDPRELIAGIASLLNLQAAAARS
jgi:PAS domain S-box-containing protein